MSDFDHIFEELSPFTIPPIEKWHPNKIVVIDLRIAADGQWFYQGTPIKRHRLVKLFATVLRLEEDGRYVLVTPQVKYRIEVEDVPFLAVQLDRQLGHKGQELYFRTNMDEVVLSDFEHPLIVQSDAENQQLKPYIMVRDGLKAKIVRSVFYELVELLEPFSDQPGDEFRDQKEKRWYFANESKPNNKTLGVVSSGSFFTFGDPM